MRWHIAMLVTLAALLLSPTVGFIQAGESEKQAVAAILKLGGMITRAVSLPGKPVVEVVLQNTKITDPALAHLKGLKTLGWLYLNGTEVSDAGLVHLKDLKQLQQLDLDGTKVSDAGLVHLKGMNQLYWLDLIGTKVSDAGLAHLKDLKQLRVLKVSNTQVTDAGIKKLQKALPRVEINK